MRTDIYLLSPFIRINIYLTRVRAIPFRGLNRPSRPWGGEGKASFLPFSIYLSIYLDAETGFLGTYVAIYDLSLSVSCGAATFGAEPPAERGLLFYLSFLIPSIPLFMGL